MVLINVKVAKRMNEFAGFTPEECQALDVMLRRIEAAAEGR